MTTAELDAIAEEHIRGRGATPVVPRLPRLPGDASASRVNDEIVHGIPGTARAGRAATWSPSTAGRSSTAGTATPPSPSSSADGTPTRRTTWRWSTRPRTSHVGTGSRPLRVGGRLSDIGAAVEDRRRRGPPARLRHRRGVRRPRHRHRDAPGAAASRTTACAAAGPTVRSGLALAVEPMVTLGSAETRSWPTTGPWSPRTVAGPRTGSTRGRDRATALGADRPRRRARRASRRSASPYAPLVLTAPSDGRPVPSRGS